MLLGEFGGAASQLSLPCARGATNGEGDAVLKGLKTTSRAERASLNAKEEDGSLLARARTGEAMGVSLLLATTDPLSVALATAAS